VFSPTEPVAAWTHLLGALVALGFAVPLLRGGQGDSKRQRVLGLFALSVFLQLAISGIYHWQTLETQTRLIWQRADHAAIWLVVVGCFLPIRHYLFSRRFGTGLLIVICLVASLGLLLETALHDVIPSWIVVLLYVVFGSIGTPVALWLVATRGLRYTLTFFLCGVSFSAAAMIELVEEPTLIEGLVGYHEIVHVLVLMGFAFHWAFVAQLTRQARANAELDRLSEAAAPAESEAQAV
jgi:hemolysin III